MQEIMTRKGEIRYFKERKLWEVQCKFCDHKTAISPNLDYIICSHCGHKLYNKKANFKMELEKVLKRRLIWI